MSALNRLRARYNAGQPMTDLELVVLNSNNENTARQLEELYEEVRASGKAECPVCCGMKYLIFNDGLMHPCPSCEGTGKST